MASSIWPLVHLASAISELVSAKPVGYIVSPYVVPLVGIVGIPGHSLAEKVECNMCRPVGPLGERTLEVELLWTGPWGELLEQPGVIGVKVGVQKLMLLPDGKMQMQPRYREPCWAGWKAECKVLPIIPTAKFLIVMVVGEEGGERFVITHIRGHVLMC